MTTSTLFDSIKLGRYELANRVTMAALTRQRAGEDGVPTELHREYYTQRASMGLVVTEGTFPDFWCRSFPGQAGIANEEQADGWAEVASSVHEAGGVLFMQIMHGGRTCHPDLLRGAHPEAPSAIASGNPVRGFSGKQDSEVPHAMSAEDLERVRDSFVAASRRAIDAGVDGVEIHSANGYLLHEFLSPTSNTRTDEYGGSPENRARFVVEVIRAVAEEIGSDRVGFRISPQHNIQGVLEQDYDNTEATYATLIDDIRELNLAYMSVLYADIDGNANGNLVKELRRHFNGTLILNSGFAEITTQTEAQHIIEDNLADAVAVGRLAISNPDLVHRWKEGLELTEPDQSTFYTAGAEGYTDYPFSE